MIGVAAPAGPRPPRSRRVDRWNAAVNGVAMSRLWTLEARAALLRRLGLQVGPGTGVQPCFIGSSRVELGADCYVGPGCVLDGADRLVVGDRVGLGPGAVLLTSSHDASDPRRRCGPARNAPLTIGAGAWIGARAVVLPGVVVGEGCVVAAGAVVTSDCAPHGLYAGIPARRVRELPGGSAV